MFREEGNTVLDNWADVENGQRHDDLKVYRSLREMQTRADSSSESKAGMSRIALSLLAVAGYMAPGIEPHRIGIDIWIMEHLPVIDVKSSGKEEWLRCWYHRE